MEYKSQIYAQTKARYEEIYQRGSKVIKSLTDKMRNRAFDFTVLSFLFIGLLFIFICSSSSLQPLFSFPKSLTSNMFNMTTQIDELDAVLAETSLENRTLIIAMVNKAYVEGDKSMLDLFMDGFWYGDGTQALIDHLLIVASDQVSYRRCKFLRLHCYKLETDGVDFTGERLYMSDDFVKMMWRRTLFLGDVLKRGYNFIFTDTDVLWFRNPFTVLSPNETIDLQISTDSFKGDEWAKTNHINTGFYMVRSNNRTIAMLDSWYARKDNSGGKKEQDVLAMLMTNGVFRRLGLRVSFLDTNYFSGFCENSRDVGVVVTVHANCCRSISAKATDLVAVIHDWKKAQGLSGNESSTFRWSEHVACRNTLKNI